MNSFKRKINSIHVHDNETKANINGSMCPLAIYTVQVERNFMKPNSHTEISHMIAYDLI